LLWASTVLVDSLISFAPSELDAGPGGLDAGGASRPAINGGGGGGGGDGGGSGIHAFRLVLLYGALSGELVGKWVNFFFGFRLSGGHAERERARALLRGEKLTAAPPEPGVDAESVSCCGRAALLLRRWLSRPGLLLLLTCVRTLCAVPLLVYLTQPMWAGAGQGLYCDACYVAAQSAFDFAGALLSCLCYAVAPRLLSARRRDAPQSSALLALSLTAGTYAGLAAAFALEQLVLTPAGAAVAV
jgi:hypothetical protein